MPSSAPNADAPLRRARDRHIHISDRVEVTPQADASEAGSYSRLLRSERRARRMAPDGPDTSLTIGDEDLRALPTPADMPAGSTSRRARRNNLLAEAEVKAQGRSTKLADAAAVPATRRTRRAEREHTPAVPSPVAVPEPHAALQPGPVAANPADLVIASAVNE